VAKLQALRGVTLQAAPSSAPRRAFTVCHQKFVVIDANIVIVGSANWATTSVPNPGARRWKKGNREWIMAIESVEAAALFTRLFDTDWDWKPPEELEAVAAAPAPEIVPVLTGFAEEMPPTPEILAPAEF